MRRPDPQTKRSLGRRVDPRLRQPFELGSPGIFGDMAGVEGLRRRPSVSVISARLCSLDGHAASLASERGGRLLSEFLSAITDVAVAHRAMIDAPSAAAIRLLYGLPHSRPDDAIRALRAALDMQQAFLALRNRWEQREAMETDCLGLAIGVASGAARIIPLAQDPLSRWAATSTAIASAARIGSLATGNELLLDRATRERFESSIANRGLDVVLTQIDLPGRAIFRCQYRRGRLHAVPR